MLKVAIKFCGGCNPRFDRGAVYREIREKTATVAAFSLPDEGVAYDALIIIRGCTGCPYLYEEIDAAHRLVLADESEMEELIAAIHALNNMKNQ